MLAASWGLAGRNPDVEQTTKTCTRCQTCKPLSEFYRRTRSHDGHASACKSCDERRRRRYREILRETGPLSLAVLRKPDERGCGVAGCERRHYGHGWCALHCWRWKEHGDPLVVRSVADNSGTCLVADCNVKATSRGWCNVHYQRWYVYGDPMAPVRQLLLNGGSCSIEDCALSPRSRTSKWCEKHYMRWYRQGDPTRVVVDTARYQVCQHCGTYSAGRKACSSRCAARIVRGTLLITACQVCGESFPTKNTRNTCSPACKREGNRRRGVIYHQNAMETSPGYRDSLRRATLRRRARMKAAFVEDFSPFEIHGRDGWICGICHELIDPTVLWPNRWSATIDHVVPLALGGVHHPDNAQSAHLTCNCSKRDRLGVRTTRRVIQTAIPA